MKGSRRPRRPKRGSCSTRSTSISARATGTVIPEREVANELRRDNGNILGNENLTFAIDTFHDRRNGYVFQTNALGALRDMAVTDDQQNQAWNGIWHVKTARFENGWTMEVAIPFKSLRYRGSGPQTWGINLRRLVKWKNEFSYLSLVPAALGTGGISRMASAATVVGLETPAQSKNLELKPYAVASSTTDRAGASPFDNRGAGQRGTRLQVRADAKPDRRCDLPHRFRAGGGGRPADQPDALQRVLSGEARLLHRRPGHFRFRRRAGRQQSRRRAAAVLQPADRLEPGPGGAGRRRRAADRPRRRVQHRRAQHPDRGQAVGQSARHEFLRAPPQAQSSAPQQRRRDGDPPRARARQRRRLGRRPATPPASTPRCCSSRASTSRATTR